MPQLFVHLAPADVIAAHVADDNPEHSRSSALAEAGVWHRVDGYKDRTAYYVGDEYVDEARIYVTACGISQEESYNRSEELPDGDVPGGALCPDGCFEKGK